MAAALALIGSLPVRGRGDAPAEGALNLDGVSLANPMSLVRLVGQRMWLFGTAALLVGYVLQAGALDRGRLAVIQPLLVTTIVFALPLGWWLTSQHVGRREVGGGGRDRDRARRHSSSTVTRRAGRTTHRTTSGRSRSLC